MSLGKKNSFFFKQTQAHNPQILKQSLKDANALKAPKGITSQHKLQFEWMNNIIHRVNRFLSWKNRHYQQQQQEAATAASNRCATQTNEYQLQASPPSISLNSNADLSVSIDTNSSSTSHLLGEPRPRSNSHSAGSNQPLIDTAYASSDLAQDRYGYLKYLIYWF